MGLFQKSINKLTYHSSHTITANGLEIWSKHIVPAQYMKLGDLYALFMIAINHPNYALYTIIKFY